MFWAFQPKRVIVPSFTLVPGQPWLIRPAANAERLLRGTVGLQIGENRIVVDGFDQSCTEQRSRNAEHHILAGHRGAEIRLVKRAARRIPSPSDRKERVHSAVGRTVRIKLESGFAHRTVFLNKRRHVVVCTLFLGHLNLWIYKWTGSPDVRLSVAAGATVQVEARPEAEFCVRYDFIPLNRLHFFKVFTTTHKQLLLELGQI